MVAHWGREGEYDVCFTLTDLPPTAQQELRESLLWLDDELRDLIAGRAPLSRIKEAARGRGMRSLRDAAVALVLRGESTVEELERVTLAD